MADEIRFVVPGLPVGWARAGRGGGFTFTPGKQRSFMAVLKDYCERAMAGMAPIEGPVALEVVATYAWPKSFSAKKRREPGARWKVSRPDLDNCTIKIVADALNGLAFHDDAQIAHATLAKHYEDRALLAVVIRPLTA